MTPCSIARSSLVVLVCGARSTTTDGSSSGDVVAGRTSCSAWYDADASPSVMGVVLGRSGWGPAMPSSRTSTESFLGLTRDDAGTAMPIGGVRFTSVAAAVTGFDGGPTPGSVETCAMAGVGVGSVGARADRAPGVDG